MKVPAILTLFMMLWTVSPTTAQGRVESPKFVPGKYCCKTPEPGYNGCIVFKDDGSYEARATLHEKEGSSNGTWKRTGNQIVLKPDVETGSLVGYLTRFSIEGEKGESLTWLPRVRQDFSRTGGAVVYPRYTRVEEKGI